MLNTPQKKAAWLLRNYANTMMNMGGVTTFFVHDILGTATLLDGQQPDARFSDVNSKLDSGGTIAKFLAEMDELRAKLAAMERTKTEVK